MIYENGRKDSVNNTSPQSHTAGRVCFITDLITSEEGENDKKKNNWMFVFSQTMSEDVEDLLFGLRTDEAESIYGRENFRSL